MTFVTPASDPGRRFVAVNGGTRLHLLDWGGGGRPILLLHGIGGHAWMWAHIAPALRPLGRPLAPDLRGFGDSEWAAADAPYTTEGHLADVIALADVLELEELDVVGFSWGGLVALALGAQQPERVRRLAIVDIAPSSAMAVDAIPPGFRGRFADHADAVEGERALAPRATDALLEAMAAFGTRSDPAGGLVRKLDPRFLTSWPFRADDRWAELREVRARTLVVRAAESPLLSAADAERMAAELSDGRVETIADSGHLIALEQPQRLTDSLRAFLSAP